MFRFIHHRRAFGGFIEHAVCAVCAVCVVCAVCAVCVFMFTFSTPGSCSFGLPAALYAYMAYVDGQVGSCQHLSPKRSSAQFAQAQAGRSPGPGAAIGNRVSHLILATTSKLKYSNFFSLIHMPHNPFPRKGCSIREDKEPAILLFFPLLRCFCNTGHRAQSLNDPRARQCNG